MIYTVKEIIEPDFGCEGFPEGYEPECEVILADDSGNRITVSIKDKELYQKDIIEGSRVDLSGETVEKIK